MTWACSVAQSCLALCDPMDRSPPGSSVRGISQARMLEWVATSFSGGDHPYSGIKPVSPASPALAGRFFTTELPIKPMQNRTQTHTHRHTHRHTDTHRHTHTYTHTQTHTHTHARARRILISQTGIKLHTPCIGMQSLNHWITREIPTRAFKKA